MNGQYQPWAVLDRELQKLNDLLDKFEAMNANTRNELCRPRYIEDAIPAFEFIQENVQSVSN